MTKRQKIIEQLKEKIKKATIKMESNHKNSFIYQYYDGKRKAYKEAIEIIEEALPESLDEWCKNNIKEKS